MATMNISLPDELKSRVEQRVSDGLYANASDYVRDLIRQDVMGVDRLWTEIERGVMSEDSSLSPEDAINLAKRRVQSRAA
jgi:antitoxin ParD1/3/4